MMNITYDKEADAVYIEFKKGRFHKNKKIDEYTVIDEDKNGKILGIEILQASKRISPQSLSEVDMKKTAMT
jgi:uncharacterized protein YuzE